MSQIIDRMLLDIRNLIYMVLGMVIKTDCYTANSIWADTSGLFQSQVG